MHIIILCKSEHTDSDHVCFFPRNYSQNEAGAYAAVLVVPTDISFFVWVSQRSVVSDTQAPVCTEVGEGGAGQGNSFFLWPIVLPQFENTSQLFHPQFCSQRNRKCLHHRLHPSSPAERSVTFIDFWLSFLSTNMTNLKHYSWKQDHCQQKSLSFSVLTLVSDFSAFVIFFSACI